MLYLEEHLPQGIRSAFTAKVQDIAVRLGIPADWLMAVMWKESRLNHKAVNPNGGATGLIQFMPATADYLGTSTAKLRQMTAVEQLDYVYQYYKPYRNYVNSYEDLYLITFYPNAEGKHANTLTKPDNWAFPAHVHRQNSAIDSKFGNGDGKLTIADFRAYALKDIPSAWRNVFTARKDDSGQFVNKKKAGEPCPCCGQVVPLP